MASGQYTDPITPTTECGHGHHGGGLNRELYPPRDVERMLSLSHSTLYRLLRTRRIEAVKIGRATYIPRASIERFLAELPAANIRTAA